MLGSVIFHSQGELRISAVVHGWWNQPLVALVIASDAHVGFGFNVDNACLDFVRWLFSQTPVPGSFHLESLPGLPWAGEDHDPWEWYDRVMAEVAAWDPPPVLVDMDASAIAFRGDVVWPSPERRRVKRPDRRIRLPGSLFPVGWYGCGLGEFRSCASTYQCYPPSEIPPIPSSLTGAFDWLRTAPEHGGSIAPYPDPTFEALDRLLAANPSGLPPEFVEFFRSPQLWARIRSCTDCYLQLDSTAVGVRGGQGTLIRFLCDSQSCCHWSLWLSPCGSRHSVVETYHFSGSEFLKPNNRLAHPRDITTCAESFEEFIYRFWLENELWFALHDHGPMPAGGEAYLDFYRSKDAESEGRRSDGADLD